MTLAHSTIEDLVTLVRDYRPSDLLPRIRRLSDEVKAAGAPGLSIEMPPNLRYGGLEQKVLVGPHLPALIARLSVIVGHELASGTLTGERFLRLVRMGCDLYDPAMKGDAWRFFLRTIYEQAPFQESVWELIPRALLMYEEANRLVSDKQHDIERDFEEAFSLSVRDYLTLGFALYAQFISDPVFFPLGGWHTEIPSLRDLLKTDKKEALLRLVCADAGRFRSVNSILAQSESKTDSYDFNSLFMYPVIDLGSGKCVSPVMDLLAIRLYDAPYYELANLAEGAGKRNSFRAFFGKIFHEYTGMLLREAFGSSAVSPEFGPNPPGPVDWAVFHDECGVLIECRASELSLPARYSADETVLQKDLQRIVIETVDKLERKRSMIEGSTLKPANVAHWHLLMVVKEPLLPVPHIRALIDAGLSQPVRYHLMSTDDLEQLLALHGTEGVCRILVEKEADSHIDEDFRTFFSSHRTDYAFRRNPLIERTYDQYFAELAPALARPS